MFSTKCARLQLNIWRNFPMISFMTEQCNHKGVHKYKEMTVANMNSKY